MQAVCSVGITKFIHQKKWAPYRRNISFKHYMTTILLINAECTSEHLFPYLGPSRRGGLFKVCAGFRISLLRFQISDLGKQFPLWNLDNTSASWSEWMMSSGMSGHSHGRTTNKIFWQYLWCHAVHTAYSKLQNIGCILAVWEGPT